MKIVISVLIFFFVGNVFGKSDRIKLKDVQVLTLRKGKYTEARRSHRVPQLACVGGSARCSFIPETVQCYNRGWDGVTVNWECKADMDKKYSFGQLEVTCEGYDHPDDSYILAGSCGLEFSLNIANGAYQERVFKPPPYPGKSASEASELGSQSIFFIVIVFGVLIFIIYLFRSPPNAHEPSAPPPPPGFRPDYFTGSGYNDYTSGPSCGSGGSARSQEEGPGFGTGFLTGGFLGYLFGRNSSGPNYTRDYSSSHTSHNSGYSRTSSEPFIPPETGTETKTGYATTKRR
ncbi:store-operated calcium entry-associated regulatory factor-like [Panonychus citri]|uniref:store-operated calcium entry-associated regulatory factor-like n=1 Tax=Panonychus citri TaxID=50023 RepID=UPI002307CB06|nr:store-operated calcium entry-associated regulatory factor-like [Panonychus citri]